MSAPDLYATAIDKNHCCFPSIYQFQESVSNALAILPLLLRSACQRVLFLESLDETGNKLAVTGGRTWHERHAVTVVGQ